MRKTLCFVFFLLIVSCNNKETLTITTKLEQELCEQVYLDKPIKGKQYSVKTFIDSAIQKTVMKALTESVINNDARKGFVVVMETNTGKIKAMVNLEKGVKSKYIASNKLDINVPIEPGSLIKTFDLMSLLEDRKADTATVYNAKGGEIRYLGKKIIDSHKGFKNITLGKAFLYSSNTVFVQAIDSAYGQNPIQFSNNFKKFGLNKDLKLPFSHAKKGSVIPTPMSDSWSNISLPWMAFGYGITLTPIQILTYYNAIANDGVMVKPLFLSKIESKEGETKEYSKIILNNSICSKSTITILQDLLSRSMIDNTKKNHLSAQLALTNINYASITSIKEYASSLAGYFPSEKPKYSIFVYVKNSNKDKVSSKVDVAKIVFNKIAASIR
jgi:cell division protein FtsI (penicillin-binding protein 3)